MSIPVIHTLKLKKIKPEDPKSAPYRVNCSCQWEGMAHTRQVADGWMRSHAFAQTQRGNEVIIEIDPSAEEPSKVDANG